jgi:predicted regulator of Ras-like GTPase activity (Roadblock/LC7/MglB family)
MKFKIGNRLWVEDDATRNLEGHVSLADAFRQITSTALAKAETLVTLDRGDYDERVVRTESGRVLMLVVSFDGGEIHEAELVS